MLVKVADDAVLDAAERLGRVHDLGRRIRAKAVEPLGRLPEEVVLFLNLHPSDLLDEDLFNPDGALAAVASQVVLEITERSSLQGIGDVRERVASLRKLGVRIALDDLGAGYAGLTSFALLEPDIVKLDMALVRDLHREPTKQTLVRTMISMCKERVAMPAMRRAPPKISTVPTKGAIAPGSGIPILMKRPTPSSSGNTNF